MLSGAFLLSPLQRRACSQEVTATLVGVVSDNSGAAIGNAQVTITEQQTGAARSQATNGSGNYEFTLLPPGVYTVKVSMTGFETKIMKDVRVPVNTTVRVNVELQVGQISQSVTVTDQAPLLQTDRGDVSQQIESKQVEDLPNGSTRNFQSFESLAPGVSTVVYDQSSFFNAQNSQSFEVNGQSVMSNNLQIEGIDDNEFSGALQVYIPPAEAIQAVDVETSNYSPEFGRSAGGVTNVVLKSGTNGFHGSAYEYNQVSATQARSYFNNTGARPQFTYNYTGGAFGGPIQKDRTFFFVDFLRTSNVQRLYELFTLPTSAFRTGDLSASPTPIYDPATGNANGSGRSQFVTNGVPNVIPSNRIDPVVTNLLTLLPEPNIPNAGFTNNYQTTLPYSQISDQVDAKFDENLNSRDHLVYRYSWQQVVTNQAPAFGNEGGGPGGASAGFEGTGNQNIFNTAGEYTHIFSPTLLTELRLGVDHDHNTANPSGYGLDTSTQLGIPGANISAFTSGLSSMLVSDFSSPLLGYSAFEPWDRAETNADIVNDWTKVIANHSLKIGGEVRLNRQDLYQIATYSPRGEFEYGEGQTGINASGSKTSLGNAFASFLLDQPSLVAREINANGNIGNASWREQVYSFFVQDTWQASPKLTLTYGLRMGILPPAYPKAGEGGFSQYDPSANSLQLSGYPGGISNTLGVSVHDDYEPRIGFAYRARANTVVRGGFGISHTPWQGLGYAYNYPVRTNVSFNTLSSYTPALNGVGQTATLEQGFPAPAPVAVSPNGTVANAPIASSWSVVNTSYKDPSVASYNLTVENNLGKQWVGTVAYVGNVGRAIPAGYNLNAGLVAGAGAKGQPEYSTFGRSAATTLYGYSTTSNYNALQLTLKHQFSHGLAWTSSYTWQKAMGWISNSVSDSGLSFYLPGMYQRNYSVLGYNSAQTYAQSAVYELPFGKNQPFVHSGWASQVAGGWELSSILHVNTGTPLTFTASGAQLNAPGTIQLAKQVASLKKLYGIGTTRHWFDPTSFVTPAGATEGNIGQNIYSGPGLFTLDSSIFRQFPIRESLVLKLRMDAFNVLNHPVFNNPSTSLTSASFGEVTSTAGTGVNGTPGTPRQLQFAATINF
jgi:hypothetical protein